MSLRKSRKRRAAGKAAKALTVYKLAQPVGGAIKAYTRARAGKGLAKRAPGRKPLAVAGLFGAVGLAALMRKRRGGEDLGYGPPNESHPSHETLAPSRAAAEQADTSAGESNGSKDVATGGASSEAGGSEEKSDAPEPTSSDEPAGPPGDEAGTEDAAREESAETTG